MNRLTQAQIILTQSNIISINDCNWWLKANMYMKNVFILAMVRDLVQCTLRDHAWWFSWKARGFPLCFLLLSACWFVWKNMSRCKVPILIITQESALAQVSFTLHTTWTFLPLWYIQGNTIIVVFYLMKMFD